MIKQFLIATHLLALTAAPVQPQSVETARSMGEIVGKYYCYAIGIGVQNNDEMADAIMSEKDPLVARTVAAAHRWYESGETKLYKAYVRSLDRHTTIYCQEGFDLYLERNR